MNAQLLAGITLAAALPLAAQAQDGAAAGTTTGAVTGAIVGGPLGAAVVAGVEEDLPSAGVTYCEVPREYGVKRYRYTVVNDRTAQVDPSTHRIQVIY